MRVILLAGAVIGGIALVVFLVMVATYVAALALRLPGFPSVMGHNEQWSFLWALGFAMTLPVYALFGNTRFSTVPARVAFSAAVFAHMLYQIIIIGLFASNNGLPSSSGAAVAVEIGVLLSVAVPAWVIFRQHRLYVTCQSHEDIPYLLQFGTEDHLMIGTDYSHADQSAEIEAIDMIRRMGEEGRITKTQVKKILEDNPAAFYGL